MIYETISLSAGGGTAALTAILPSNTPAVDPARRRRSVLICPGGAYAFCSGREGEPVAVRFAAEDYNAFVLNYSAGEGVRYPTALRQLAAAVKYIRDNADRLNALPEEIYVLGFSAGGHLAASLGVRWKEPWLAAELGIESAALRPAGLILCYPVITGGPETHQGSMENLVGPDRSAWAAQSLETLADADTPDTFLWSTFDDESVPIANSLLFLQALAAAGVGAEAHIFAHGYHGSSLANRCVSGPCSRHDFVNPDVAEWMPLALRWLEKR